MSDSIHILRVVVASPADVPAERDVVPLVAQELNKSVCADRGLRLEVMRWETDSYPGFHADGPQGIIDPIIRVEDCDVLVGIFWKRFGSPTRDSDSGTIHEFQLAYEAWKKKRHPQVMVYFNQKPYSPQSKEETDQWGRVLEFRKAFPKEGLWWPYKGTSAFGNLLRTHLTNFVRDNFPLSSNVAGVSSQRVSRQKLTRAEYFAVQSRIVEEYTRTFVGRANAKRAFREFLENHRRGYFIVRGAPGQGKTAFSCQLVKEAGYVHQFISRTGGRTDPRLILRSLVSQLLPPTREENLIPESLPELTKTFEELLPIASATDRQRLVIVVDALDELPADLTGDPPYLVGDTLPEGVFFFVTSRPGSGLSRLQERLFTVPQQVYDLGPLDISEILDFLRSGKPNISPAEVDRVAVASQGSPLYLRAVVDQLRLDPAYSLERLPTAIEGFFTSATSGLDTSNAALGDVLALLSIARMPLSIRHLSEITNRKQREISDQGIGPVRQFLLEIDGAYTFYHMRFHEFVTRTKLYEDEVTKAHRKIADWLLLPASRTNEYRLNSLAYHLFESGDFEELTKTINEEFLAEKVRKMGYEVLEDIELWTRSLLQMEDPALVARCVSLVETLIETEGDDIIPDATETVQPCRSGREPFGNRLVEQSVQSFPGLDVYVGILPKVEVSADFVEMVPMSDRFILAIGDAPRIGLRSAFVARFIGNLFRKFASRPDPLHMNEILARVNSTIWGHDYFERVSMQCAQINSRDGIAYIASAGHPYPVHYSARRRMCDVLPLCGELLNDTFGEESTPQQYEEYGLRIAPGDILVFITDGLAEGHVISGEPYGYRFTEVIRAHAAESARAIGEAILDGWKKHPHEDNAVDDVSVIVTKAV
jgi:hypothetical protein